MGAGDPRENMINFTFTQERSKSESEHRALLAQYLAVAPHLIPSSDPSILLPTLWHQDLSLDNIFISEDALEDGKISITSIIDWQHTWVGPLYLKARVPNFAHYPGIPSEAKLPANVDTLTKEQLAVAKSGVELAELHLAYETLSANSNPAYGAASELLSRPVALNLFNLSGLTWEGYYSKASCLNFRAHLFLTEAFSVATRIVGAYRDLVTSILWHDMPNQLHPR
jgi:hypothetical protein